MPFVDCQYRVWPCVPPRRRRRTRGPARSASSRLYCRIPQATHMRILQTNVLVDELYQAVIADFGLALFASGHSKNYASRRTGNSGWTAPELFHADGLSSRPTTRSDVYSFAIVCVEVRGHISCCDHGIMSCLGVPGSRTVHRRRRFVGILQPCFAGSSSGASSDACLFVRLWRRRAHAL